MLEIKNLTVSVQGEIILRDLNLQVPDKQTVILFGPNGSGKSSLFETIIGLSKYQVEQGSIVFNNQDITSLSIDERHSLGLAMMFQQPPKVEGVRLKDLVDHAFQLRGGLEKRAERLNVKEFLEKGINQGLSGGEQKRSELFQLLVDDQAGFYLFDEPDSGVDLENMVLIGKVINELVKNKTGLLITHTGDILDYVQSNIAYVMIDGRIVCSGNPKNILDQIKDQGYSACFDCQKEGPDE